EFRPEMVPALWRERFGSDPFLRIAVAFAGGVLLGLGARWAGGCTSGHGISGTTQLAASSWLAVICFFIGGIATAMILFGAGG
ncbi:MAG TPA: YeeE/YedE thiosulfate transporter family protein, partial [Methanothrix sp.]|nr:YeeE/YedE thiosulfate transporter family protein [Methanothrix sp.]